MPKQRVNLTEVTMAAVTLADEARSLDGLTLSAVAGQLGVRPSALYTYFDGLDALRAAVAVQATINLTERLRDAAVGQAGDDAVMAMAEAYRSFATTHPGQYASTLTPTGQSDPSNPSEDPLAEASQRLTEVFARVIASYGHDGDRALHAAQATRSAIHGFVAIECCQGFAPSTDRDASFTHLVATLIAGLR
jgi:AcrR family transcriptional regulator